MGTRVTLSVHDRTELDRLGVENVRLKLAYAGPSRQSVIPGLLPGYVMTRGDVEDWLAERTREARQAGVFWAKAAACIGVVIILVIIIMEARVM
jgi:hypothetical protein